MTSVDVDEQYAEGIRGLLRTHASRPGEFAAPHDLQRDASEGGWFDLAGVGFSGSGEISLESALLACEVFGREVAPFSVVTTVGFIQPLLSSIGEDTPFAARLSAWIAEGTVIGVPAGRVSQVDGDWRFTLEGDVGSRTVAGGTRLSGRIEQLTDADASVALITFDNGASIAAVPLDSPGVTVTVMPSVVPGLSVARVELDDVEIESALLHSDGTSGHVHRAGAVWSLVLDAYAVGTGRELVDRTVAFVTTREQFGQPIGAFQAVQHLAADMHVAAETSFGIMREAAKRWVDGASDAVPYIAASRLHCAASAVSCCESAIQLHGGAGFTWELGLHYWYRSAQFLLRYLTDEAALRDLLAAHISHETAGATPSAEDTRS